MKQDLQPSVEDAKIFLSQIEHVLNTIRADGKHLAKMELPAWPLGLDRRILNLLHLQRRTQNCMLGEKFLDGNEILKVKDVMRYRNFGRKSLMDLLLTLKNYLNECIKNPSTTPRLENEMSNCSANQSGLLTQEEQACSESWRKVKLLLNPILATVAELHEATTIGAILSDDVMRIATRLKVSDKISDIKINTLSHGVSGPISLCLSQIALVVDSLSEANHVVLEQRLIQTPPVTLEEIGIQLGVTRERVRQVQDQLERRLHTATGEKIELIASEIKEHFGNIVDENQLDLWFRGKLPTKYDSTSILFKKMLLAKMDFTLDKGMYLDKSAKKELQKLKTMAHRLADDVGLISETDLVANLPNRLWHDYWLWVRSRIGLKQIHDTLGLKCSKKAMVKAALLSIGQPASRQEIGKICGIKEDRVGSYLSNISSIARADKDRWGLRDWIEDEYRGIVAEIIQRIEEDGGSTTVDCLMRELPEKFKVTRSSVRAYMQTPKFVIQDGHISVANISSIRLRQLDDVIDGRDYGGNPYWTFSVEARHFDGYSVLNVPPEFAKALGCGPDSNEHVEVDNLPSHPILSIRWNLSSTTGASLGHVTEPLKQLGLKLGGRVRVTIKGKLIIHLAKEENNDQSTHSREADETLERIRQRRRLF